MHASLALEAFPLPPGSLIEPAAWRAFLETRFQVGGEAPFTLHFGEHSEPLERLHRAQGVQASAFLTAWNPFHRQARAEDNQAAQAHLIEEVGRRGLSFIDGIGVHPSNGWPGEPSLLVLGLDLEAARALGRRFGQSALVWSGADAVPLLVALR